MNVFSFVCIFLNFFHWCLYCCLVVQSCPTLCEPMDCGPPGFSVHEISQARILELVAISFSRGSSQPRDRIHVSCLTGRFFTTEPPGKPEISMIWCLMFSKYDSFTSLAKFSFHEMFKVIVFLISLSNRFLIHRNETNFCILSLCSCSFAKCIDEL